MCYCLKQTLCVFSSLVSILCATILDRLSNNGCLSLCIHNRGLGKKTPLVLISFFSLTLFYIVSFYKVIWHMIVGVALLPIAIVSIK